MVLGLPDFDEGVLAQEIVIPLFDESLQTEVTKHGHMASIEYKLQKFHHNFRSLGELGTRVGAAAFPVKHDAVRIDSFDIAEQILNNWADFLFFHTVENVFEGRCLAYIDEHLCSLEGLLLDCSEEIVV